MSLIQVLGIVVGILGFLFLIIVHEGGHFFVSKLFHVRVNEFSIGMGPLVYSKEKNGTNYSFRALPIGGYCSLQGEFPEDMTDEEIENYVDEDPNAFVNQPYWKQILILFAGPLVNFIFGFLLCIVCYTIVAKGEVGFLRIIAVSFDSCLDMIKELFSFLFGFFNGSSSINDMSGVVGIVEIVADTASYGLVNVLYLVALLSVNIGFCNLIPIPGLDGGRILVTAIRIMSFGKLSNKAENVINGIGTALLLVLIVIIMIKDIVGLI